jgi:surface polysaccharide O-acyltransferase-like enzyme
MRRNKCTSAKRQEIEAMRGIAIIFVIFSHTLPIPDGTTIWNLIRFIFVDATVWFIFISGYLFYHLEKDKFTYNKYMKKKLVNVLLPYFIVSIPAIAASLMVEKERLMGMSKFAYAGWTLLVGSGALVPLWFVPMIFTFFLASPVFMKISKGNALPITTLFATIFSLFSARPIINANPLLSFAHFAGPYLLGIYASRESLWIQRTLANTKHRYMAIAAGILLASYSFYMYEGKDAVESGFFDRLGYFAPEQLGKLSMLMTILALITTKRFSTPNALSTLAMMSFGLFFVHGLWILALSVTGWTDNPTSSIPKYIEISTAVTILSMATVKIIQTSLGKYSTYVIGC